MDEDYRILLADWLAHRWISSRPLTPREIERGIEIAYEHGLLPKPIAGTLSYRSILDGVHY